MLKSVVLLGFVVLAVSSAQAIVLPLDETGEGENHFVSSNGGVNPPFTGININTFVGANRFYAAGYTGTNSVAANVEAGHMWGGAAGHETLTQVTQYTSFGAPIPQNGETDRHATWVGMMIGGRLTAPANEYQRGITYNSTVWSGAIASAWVGVPYAGSFNFNNSTYLSPYGTFFQTGVGANNRTADVINSSWGNKYETDGSWKYTKFVDGLANQNRLTTLVFSVGNEGDGPNTVGGPASGHNSIGAAALTSDTAVPPYNAVANFSSRGPSDYWDPVNGKIPATTAQRATVDIAAPGTDLTSAYYGGRSGGNSALLGPADGPAGGVNWYTPGLLGTSFAAPIVAGGVALIDDAGYAVFAANANARDGRVVKAVLLNAADKIPGWSNNQTVVSGVLTTTQSLDFASGAGRMNLDRTFDQYLPIANGGLAGTTDVPGLGGGNVAPVGWDYGQVVVNAPNDYYINATLAGSTGFSVTLDWYRDRFTDLVNQLPSDVGFANLDLEFWSTAGGVPQNLIATSKSLYNEVEHLYFPIPQTGTYMVRVKMLGNIFTQTGDTDTDREDYGLAWRSTAFQEVIPEPATLSLIGLGLLGLLSRRRRRVA